MRYGSTELKVIFDSLSFVFKTEQDITHIPYTNKTFRNEKGKEATTITCTLKAESAEELMTVLSILHTPAEKELHFKHFYFKDVTAGERGKPEPKTADEKIWLINAEFIALDPIPYNSETGEALYG
ncbi:hypothetical protein [Halocella sp. SP3-1]|uniref:hypothetical protein n=1 Tax=Halocella sp. SP3-1 TaxID=2382161 RepID=UPI000F760448|nr:hypothetical protein [Halocella sp. SP3-1]AZO95285.1 hypothetical protein D7D81_12160 [Halocella sp. SP3-1]